jgi:hypothetical protein
MEHVDTVHYRLHEERPVAPCTKLQAKALGQPTGSGKVAGATGAAVARDTAGLSGFAERLYDRESGLPAIWRAAAASQTPQSFR